MSGPLSLPAACPWGRWPGPVAHVFWWRVVQAWGPITGPTGCALASRRCALWEWRKGVPGEAASRRCEGGLGLGALPPLLCGPSLGQAAGARCPIAVGAGVWVWGSGTGPVACVPCGVSGAAGVAGGCPGEVVPLTAVRGVWCSALSVSQLPVLGAGSRAPVARFCFGAGGVGVGT